MVNKPGISIQPMSIGTDLQSSWEAVGNLFREHRDKSLSGGTWFDVTDVKKDYIEACDMVLSDMDDRDRLGRERYGVPLTPNNGRDSLVDLYQELLDSAVYAYNKIHEIKLNDPKVGWVVLDDILHATIRNIVRVRLLINESNHAVA